MGSALRGHGANTTRPLSWNPPDPPLRDPVLNPGQGVGQHLRSPGSQSRQNMAEQSTANALACFCESEGTRNTRMACTHAFNARRLPLRRVSNRQRRQHNSALYHGQRPAPPRDAAHYAACVACFCGFAGENLATTCPSFRLRCSVLEPTRHMARTRAPDRHAKILPEPFTLPRALAGPRPAQNLNKA